MNNAELLSQAFFECQPLSSAKMLQEFPPEEAAALLRQMPLTVLTSTLSVMASWPATRILMQLSPALRDELLRELTPSKAETLLRLMPQELRDSSLKRLPANLAKSFRLKLTYPLSTVGAWMDTSIPYFTSDSSVADCLDFVKHHQSHLGGIIMVVDEQRYLVGLVSLDELLTSEENRPLIDLISEQIKPISARATLWEIKNHIGWSHYPTLPVAGQSNIIVGALTHSSLIEGTQKSAGQRVGNHRLSLLTHMGRAFFVTLSGLSKVIWGISDKPHGQPPPEEANHE